MEERKYQFVYDYDGYETDTQEELINLLFKLYLENDSKVDFLKNVYLEEMSIDTTMRIFGEFSMKVYNYTHQ